MRFSLGIGGRGRVRVTAFGLADAEHLVEKELRKIWPEAGLDVAEVRRADEPRRLVEEFEVSFRLRVRLEVEAETREAATAEAFRLARGRLDGSRYGRTELELRD